VRLVEIRLQRNVTDLGFHSEFDLHDLALQGAYVYGCPNRKRSVCKSMNIAPLVFPAV